MGEQPPPEGGMAHHQPSPPTSSTQLGQTKMTSAWAVGAGVAGTPRKQRSFAEIMADHNKNRNILEIILTKIEKLVDGKVTKHRNLNYDEIGTYMFDILKIPPTACLRFNYTTGRSDV